MAKIIDSERPFIEEAQQSMHPSFEYVAFVVCIPESDEFLVQEERVSKGVERLLFGRGVPGKAKRFVRMKKAMKVAEEKAERRVAMLFENDNQFQIKVIQEVGEPAVQD